MLNIGKLRAGGENYYLNSVARGVEDYYLGSGEAPGYWLATGGGEMGFRARSRKQPCGTSCRARTSCPGRTSWSLETGSGRLRLHLPSPKSVAFLHALGPKEASNDIVSAHDAAVAASLGYLERVASGVRRGKGGKISVDSKGFVDAAFRHRTSRAGDPLLQTHVLVANLIQGSDGRWGAVDARHLSDTPGG